MSPRARLPSLLAALAVATLAAGCWQREVARSYYPSGQLRTEAPVRNNALEGLAVMYDERGRKLSEAHYRAGVLHGTSTSFYENGNRKAQAQYQDGVLHGTSTSWNEAGAVTGTARFENGRLVSAPPNPDPQPETPAKAR